MIHHHRALRAKVVHRRRLLASDIHPLIIRIRGRLQLYRPGVVFTFLDTGVLFDDTDQTVVLRFRHESVLEPHNPVLQLAR